jgi:hypothetical protein
MPYEHRFGCTVKRNDCRHDPAYAGIFIHGGTCNAGPFAPPRSLSTANRFTVTLPTCNKKGEELEWPNRPRAGIELTSKPTFFQAVAFAQQLRRDFPDQLGTSDIFACTDLHLVRPSVGQYLVQRVA